MQRKDCRTQREKKGEYQGGHINHSYVVVPHHHHEFGIFHSQLKTLDLAKCIPLIVSLVFPADFNPFDEGILHEGRVPPQLDGCSIIFCDEEIHLIDVFGEGG